MVSVTKHDTPALRFDGFDDEWGAVELQQIADIVGGGTPSTSVTSFWDGDIDWYSPNEIGETAIAKPSNKRITRAGLANSSARLLPAHRTVLFTSRASIGHAAILDHPATTNQGFQSFVLKNGVDAHFIYALTSKITEIAEQLATGSTFLEISNKTVREIEVHVPATEEQRAIGELFADLDALIEQHRAKHVNLQQTKTALMQRMFPQDGAYEPELRLGGFSGHWKRVSFGDTVKSFKYGVNAAATDYDGVTKYLRITDLDESSGQFGTGLVTSPRAEEETIRDFLLEEGDMVFARTGATVGRSYLFRKDVGRTVWAGFLIRARFKRNIDPQFVAAYAQTDSYWTYVKLTSQRSGQPGLNSAEYAAMPITTPPTLEEQRAIGEVFSNLDALIAAEHRYITQLTQAKTALLQRMFV